MASRPFRLFIVSGEVSGDNLAVTFIRELKHRLGDRELHISGVGGELLQREGMESLFPASELAVMGFAAVLRRLPQLLRRIRETATAAAEFRPDLLLTIDSPDFCVRVARKVRALEPTIPIVHWVCPSVWAWRQGRARKMAPHIDRILALLPFEPAALAAINGPETVFVGHPLLARLHEFLPDVQEMQARNNLEKPLFLLLPGSRSTEIQHLLPILRDTAGEIAKRIPGAAFVMPTFPRFEQRIRTELEDWVVKPDLVFGEAAKLAAFRRARVAIAASGTVTLELALAQVPTVPIYRVAEWEAFIARRLIKIETANLPNLILGKRVVTEYIQEMCRPHLITDAAIQLSANSSERDDQLSAFAQLPERISSHETRPAERAVSAALGVIREAI